MNRTIIHYLLLFLLLPAWALGQVKKRGTETENIAAGGNTYALVIGINEYKHITPLEFAAKDAEAIYQLLLSPAFDLPASRVTLLKNADASREQVFNSLYELGDKMQKGDMLIFYFAGHGDIEAKIQTGNSLLLLPGCPEKNYLRSAEFLDMHTLKEYFSTLHERSIRTLFICDACHSGNLAGGTAGQQLTITNLQQVWGNEVKMLSCQTNEISLENKSWGNGRGVFSYFLELGLKGLADTDNGSVTLGEVKRFVENKVAEATNDRQNPVLIGDPKGEICRVDKQLLATARKQLTTGSTISGKNDIAARGRGRTNDTISAALADLATKAADADYTCEAGGCFVQEALAFIKQTDKPGDRQAAEKLLYSFCAERFRVLTNKVYDGKKIIELSAAIRSLHNAIAQTLPVLKNSYYINELTAGQLYLDAELKTMDGAALTDKEGRQLIDSLQKAIRLRPSLPVLYRKLADVQAVHGQIQAAFQSLNTYANLLPNDAYAWNYAGILSSRIERFEDASGYFKKAVTLNAKMRDAWYNLGVVSQRLGRFDEATQAFKKAEAAGQINTNDEL